MNTLTHAYPSSKWLVALAALSCTLVAANAVAAPPLPTVIVSYADLDVSKPAGAESLYRRIQSAARAVCGRQRPRELARLAFWKDCYATTVANAVATVDRPLLTALHRSKTTRTVSG